MEKLWNEEEYHNQARDFVIKSFSLGSEFFLKLKEYSLTAQTILECGCGSAGVLETIWQKGKNYYGIDIAPLGIKLAKERLKNKPNIKLSVSNVENLPFRNNSFDLVYAVAVLEHLSSAEKAINEMVRVTKKDGILLLTSPNFGSPFFPSPCQTLKRPAYLWRLLKIFFQSHLYLFIKPKKLNWTKVQPRVLKEKTYRSDWDTLIEPSMQTLLIFLKRKSFKILESYSTTQVLANRVPHELPGKSRLSHFAQFIFRTISLWVEKMGIPPYRYFGPNFFIAAKKYGKE